MDYLKFGKWSYSTSCATNQEDIWLIEMKNGDRRWYSRFDMKKLIILDAMPVDCLPMNEVMDGSAIYGYTISI
jgi:hypothetical protein